MAQDRSAPRSDPTRPHCEKLRALARWYREFAERAGNPDIWEARLRTAEELEAEAARVETALAEATSATCASADNLRIQPQDPVGKMQNAVDCNAKRQLAVRPQTIRRPAAK